MHQRRFPARALPMWSPDTNQVPPQQWEQVMNRILHKMAPLALGLLALPGAMHAQNRTFIRGIPYVDHSRSTRLSQTSLLSRAVCTPAGVSISRESRAGQV